MTNNMLLPNLMKLGRSMNQDGWYSQCFPFTFNKVHCYVLCVNISSNPKLIKVLLKFIDDNNNLMELRATPFYLKLTHNNKKQYLWTEIRYFFHIPYGVHYSNIIRYFCNKFNSHIPTKATGPKDKRSKTLIITNDDPNNADKLKCYAIRNNDGNRSKGNSEKTKILRPKLYSILMSGLPGKTPIPGISFLFTKNNSRSDECIIKDAMRNKIFNTKYGDLSRRLPLKKWNELNSFIKK